MKRKEIIGALSVLLALMLAGTAVVPTVSAIEENMDPVLQVNIFEAEQAARFGMTEISNQLNDFSAWQNGTLQNTGTYYGLDGQKTAYRYEIYSDSRYAGFILISATRDNFPVLFASKGKAPDSLQERTSLARNQAALEASQKGFHLGDEQPLYLGGTFFCTGYQLLDSENQSVDRIVYDLTDSNILDISHPRFNTSLSEEELLSQLKEKQEQSRILWEKILSNKSSDQPLATRGSGYISGVPKYYWTR